MKKISTLTAAGVLVILIATPYTGVYREWKVYTLVILGLVIAILSVSIRKELHKVLKVIHGDDKESIKDTYVENNPQ